MECRLVSVAALSVQLCNVQLSTQVGVRDLRGIREMRTVRSPSDPVKDSATSSDWSMHLKGIFEQTWLEE